MRLVALLLCCVASSLLFPAVARAQEAGDVGETVRRLQSIKPDVGAEIPAEAKPLLTRLKHQLRDHIEATLNAHALNATASERVSGARLRLRVLDVLGRAGVRVGAPKWNSNEEDAYGYVTSLEIERPPRHPQLLVAMTTISIHCGEDTSLYIFRREAGRWRLVLAQESNDYKDIGGAQAMFSYRLSPPLADGSFFVVTANVNPWCTSNWHGIRYKVLRASVAGDTYQPYRPRVILAGEESIFLGSDMFGDERYRLAVAPRSFTLRFVAQQGLDPGELTREHVLTYAVEAESARRIAPVASRPQDFLDEWVGSNWEQAKAWSALGASSSALRRWHERLHRTDDEKEWYSEFFLVERCHGSVGGSAGGGAGVWQVGLSIDSEKLPQPLPPKLYFTIVRRGAEFRLSSIETARGRVCGRVRARSG